MKVNITDFFDENEIFVKRGRMQGIRLPVFRRIYSKQAVEEITAFRIGRFGKYLQLPLSFKVDEEWFYISELLRTDGHITKKLDVIKLTNVTDELKERFKSIFSKYGIGYFREVALDRIQIHNKTLALLFVRVFQIPPGNKTFICRMPKWMKEANLGLLACALRGAFDGDGCVQFSTRGNQGGETRRLRLYGASTGYLEDIQNCLLRFGIDSKMYKDPRENKTYFLQVSRRDSIVRFANHIGFLHPKRKMMLEKVVSSYRNYYFLADFEKIAIKVVKKKGPLTINQLAKEVKRKDSTVCEQVTKLERQGKIRTKRVGVKRLVFI